MQRLLSLIFCSCYMGGQGAFPKHMQVPVFPQEREKQLLPQPGNSDAAPCRGQPGQVDTAFPWVFPAKTSCSFDSGQGKMIL